MFSHSDSSQLAHPRFPRLEILRALPFLHPAQRRRDNQPSPLARWAMYLATHPYPQDREMGRRKSREDRTPFWHIPHTSKYVLLPPFRARG